MIALDEVAKLDYKFARKIKVLDSGCWEWQGARTPDGYGNVCRKDLHKYLIRTHRYMYFLVHSTKLFGDYVVCHHCDNPPCCNPAHLFAGTVRDNTADMVRKGRDVHPTGEEHGRAKLTESEVLEIRIKLAAGVKPAKLSSEYSVNFRTISAIKKNLIWRHI